MHQPLNAPTFPGLRSAAADVSSRTHGISMTPNAPFTENQAGSVEFMISHMHDSRYCTISGRSLKGLPPVADEKLQPMPCLATVTHPPAPAARNSPFSAGFQRLELLRRGHSDPETPGSRQRPFSPDHLRLLKSVRSFPLSIGIFADNPALQWSSIHDYQFRISPIPDSLRSRTTLADPGKNRAVRRHSLHLLANGFAAFCEQPQQTRAVFDS